MARHDPKVYEVDVEIATGHTLKVGAAEISATEMAMLDGITAGTVTASKAVVVNANKDAGDFRNLDAVNIDAGSSGVAGSVDVFPATASKGKLTLACANQTGDTAVTLQADAMGQATTVHIPDTTLASTYVVQTTVAVPVAKADVLNRGGALGAHTFTVGAEGGNVINVAVQLVDAANANLAVRGSVLAYLSDDSNGDSLTAAAPSGGVVIGTDGVAIPVTPALVNALLVDGNLAISATAEKFKTTQTAAFLIGGVSHTKAATDNLTFSAAHVITASKFGVILIQINAAGTVSTKVPVSPQAYDNAGAALAALPAADAGNVALGYIAIENNAGDWTANTDDLTNGSDVTTAAFNDTTEVALGGPKMWQLVSESDGDIDLNITEAGVATWYLVLVNPDGLLRVSGAITFA